MDLKVSVKDRDGNKGFNRYLVVTFPSEMLNQCNLKCKDKLFVRIDDDNKLFVKYADLNKIDKKDKRKKHPISGGVSKNNCGYIFINQTFLGRELVKNAKKSLPIEVIGDELVLSLPDDFFVIKKGFGTLAEKLAIKQKGFININQQAGFDV